MKYLIFCLAVIFCANTWAAEADETPLIDNTKKHDSIDLGTAKDANTKPSKSPHAKTHSKKKHAKKPQ